MHSQVEDQCPESQRRHTQGTPGTQPQLLTEVHVEPHKALGLHWDTTLDTLHIATPPQLGQVIEPTKCAVASDIAITSDVLG